MNETYDFMSNKESRLSTLTAMESIAYILLVFLVLQIILLSIVCSERTCFADKMLPIRFLVDVPTKNEGTVLIDTCVFIGF